MNDTHLERLTRINKLVNAAAFKLLGHRNSCILSSTALVAVLRKCGYEANPVRVTAAIHLKDNIAGKYGCILGSAGDGTKMPAASPGNWHGHLAVRSGGLLLDPTLDQVRETHAHLQVTPLVLPLPAAWDNLDGPASCAWFYNDTTAVRYNKFHRQNGWKSSPDFRPSHWRDVFELTMRELRVP